MDKQFQIMRDAVVRIDERTKSILDNQEKHTKALAAHEERDRQDFKDVHSRVSRVERKQNWMLGIGTAAFIGITALGAFLKGVFGIL